MIPFKARFPRTTCSCSECVACCHRGPGPLALGELELIAGFLGVSTEEAKPLFVASPGSVVKSGLTGETIRVGTIVPKTIKGRCIFHAEDQSCRIHPVAPAGCACFDMHMGQREGSRRAMAAVLEHATPEYQDLRAELAPREDA